MVQLGSVLKVVDKTGIFTVVCLKVLNFSKKRIANIGDIIVVSVKSINTKRFAFLKVRLQKRYRCGSIHRALVIRSNVHYRRTNSVFFKFNDNACILVTNRVVPVVNKVYGPVLREFCTRWPSLGCVSHCIV
jgi:large subunit ribosomal protein L14